MFCGVVVLGIVGGLVRGVVGVEGDNLVVVFWICIGMEVFVLRYL